MSDLGKLTLNLIADAGGFDRGMKQAEGIASRGARSIEQSFNTSFKRLAGILAGAFSVEVFRRNITSFLDEADRLSKTAQKIGITTEALSSLEYAADMAGVSAGQLQTSMARLSTELLKARDGGKEAQATFRALQVEIRDATGGLRSSDEVLAEIADRFARMPDGVEKTALAIRLFGRAGADLVPLLNAGREGIAELRAEAERLGRVISTDTGRQAEEFNDNMKRLRMQAQQLTRSIAIEMLPALIRLSEEFVNVRGEATATGQGIAQAFAGAVDSVTAFVQFVRWAGEEFAVFRFGIAQDDLARLSQEADRIRGILNSSLIARRGQQLRFFGKDGIVKWYSEEELRRELAAIEAQIETMMSTAPRPVIQPPEIKRDPFAPLIENAENAEKAVRRAVDRIGPLLAGLVREVETFGASRADILAYDLALLGASDAQIALARSMAEMIAALEDQQRLINEGARLYEQMRTPAEQLSDEINRLNDLLDAGAISWDTYARAMFAAQERFDEMRDKVDRDTDKMSEFAIQAARNMQSAFADFLFNPFESSLRDMVRNFALAINRMVAEVLAAKILQSFFTSVLGMPDIGALFGGARAMGGPVRPGQAYLVGERGPELFAPKQAGDIIPHHALGGGGTRIINVLDPSLLEDYLHGPGETAIVNVIRRHAGSVREILA